MMTVSFATTGAASFTIDTPAAGTVAELQADVELGADRNAVVRVMITDKAEGSARDAIQRVVLGDQASAGPRPEVTAAIEKAKARPQDYEAQMTAADLYYQIQRFDDAAKFYEAAAKLKPDSTEPLIKAGNSYFDKAETAAENGSRQDSTPDFIQAEKWYTQALAKDPKNVSVRTDLGLSFFLREPRDVERAIKEYKTSLGIKPDHEVTLQNLALAYGEKGDTENQRATLEKLKAVNPNNPVFTKTEN